MTKVYPFVRKICVNIVDAYFIIFSFLHYLQLVNLFWIIVHKEMSGRSDSAIANALEEMVRSCLIMLFNVLSEVFVKLRT